jgi:plasmid stabilization system protein ParE
MERIIEAQRGQERDFAEVADWLARADVAESPRVDSLLEKVLTSLTVFPRRGAYSSMISSGQVGLLHPELANQIVNLYENVYTRLAANGEHFDYSLERDFFPAYAGAWDPRSQALFVGDPVDRLRFRNTLSLMRSWSVYYVDLLETSRAEVHALRSAIEASLGDGS